MFKTFYHKNKVLFSRLLQIQQYVFFNILKKRCTFAFLKSGFK